MTKEEAEKLCAIFQETFGEAFKVASFYLSANDSICFYLFKKLLFLDLNLNPVKDKETEKVESSLNSVDIVSYTFLRLVNSDHVLDIQREIRMLPTVHESTMSNEDYEKCINILWKYIRKYAPGVYWDLLIKVREGLPDCPDVVILIQTYLNHRERVDLNQHEYAAKIEEAQREFKVRSEAVFKEMLDELGIE